MTRVPLSYRFEAELYLLLLLAAFQIDYGMSYSRPAPLPYFPIEYSDKWEKTHACPIKRNAEDRECRGYMPSSPRGPCYDAAAGIQLLHAAWSDNHPEEGIWIYFIWLISFRPITV